MRIAYLQVRLLRFYTNGLHRHSSYCLSLMLLMQQLAQMFAREQQTSVGARRLPVLHAIRQAHVHTSGILFPG